MDTPFPTAIGATCTHDRKNIAPLHSSAGRVPSLGAFLHTVSRLDKYVTDSSFGEDTDLLRLVC